MNVEGSDSNDGENNHAGERNPSRVQHRSNREDSDRTVVPTDDRKPDTEKGVGERGQRIENGDGQSAAVGADFEYMRSAPLPTVNEYRGYEQVLPGAADRIMTMAEKSLDMEISDREQQSVALLENQRDENCAMKITAFGFTFLPWLGFISAIACAAFGFQTASWISALGGAVSAGPQIINSIKHPKK